MTATESMIKDDVSTLQRDFAAVKADLKRIQAHGGRFAERAYKSGRSSVLEAKGQLQETLKSAAAKGKEGLDQVKEHVNTQVETRPFVVVGVAVAAGLMLGMLLSPRRD